MRAYLDAMRSYADFNGRTSKSAFLAAQWIFLPLVALSFGVFGVPFLADEPGRMGGRSIWPVLCFVLIVLPHAIPWAALMVRRLHDMDRTGAWTLLALLPFGFVVPFPLAGLVIWGLRPGTPGPNRFGPDPLGREPKAAVLTPLVTASAEATAASASAPAVQRDVVSEIERLAQLKATGSLSESEFEVLKAQALLGGRAS